MARALIYWPITFYERNEKYNRAHDAIILPRARSTCLSIWSLYPVVETLCFHTLCFCKAFFVLFATYIAFFYYTIDM